MGKRLKDSELSIHAQQQAFKDSLYYTAKYLCGYDQVNERTHKDCIQVLQSDSTRKLVVMPRGTFKTSLAIVSYAIWRMIRDPDERILIESELWTLARNSLREIKSHIKSDRFQRYFPGWHLTLDNQTEMTISARTRVLKEPTMTSSGMGAGKTGSHFSVILIDDLNSPQNSHKKELAEQVIEHYRYYTSILEPGGTMVVVGTRYSDLDLIGFILKNEIEVDTAQT